MARYRQNAKTRTAALACYLARVALVSAFGIVCADGAQRLPNILLILADDLGYGDVRAYNSQSKVATPNIDGLAREGIRFTDAHSAPVCIPSRYALLTGRYMFRTQRLFQKVGLIEPGRMTLASLLKQAGYATAMVGKWHLGFEGLGVHPAPVDYSEALRGGPVDHGFDSFFGIPASLDVAPYFYIDADRVVQPPTGMIAEHHSPGVRSIQGEFWRGGPIASDFKHSEVLPRLAKRASEYLQQRAGSRQPFFLYFALPAPHAPWLADPSFRGKSGAGPYGDYVMQVDEAVGRVLAALAKIGKTNETLVIFTSDNGPTWYEADIRKYDHHAAGGFHGMKADVWEGGHRMPFIARWPGKIRAEDTSGQLIAFTDLLASFASLTGQTLPREAGEDSLDVLPALLGTAADPIRTTLILEATWPAGLLAIREGSWKLIPWLGSVSAFEGFDAAGAYHEPSREIPQSGGPQGQLYNLADDPGEKKNVYSEHPQIVKRLTELLERCRQNGRRCL